MRWREGTNTRLNSSQPQKREEGKTTTGVSAVGINKKRERGRGGGKGEEEEEEEEGKIPSVDQVACKSIRHERRHAGARLV